MYSSTPGVVVVKKQTDYEVFEALNPFFKVVLIGLKGLVDGEHFFDTFAEDSVFESRYHFPGWPVTIQGRANLMARPLWIREDNQGSLWQCTCCSSL
jgi:hypothetical protein